METVLQLLKIDLGINHTLRDEYFNKLIESCNAELKDKGIVLDLTQTKDVMLLSDYSAWNYRKRNEEVGLSRNLKLRIRNRIMKGRAADV